MSEDEQDTLIPKTEFNYPLLVPFNIARNGELVPVSFITFNAPTAKVIAECSALKQAFFRASQEAEGGETGGDTNQEIFGHDIMNLIAMSKVVDMPEVMEVAKKLFMAPNIAMVEGDTKFGQAMFDKLSAEDFECAVGEYMVNFTLASSLKRLLKTSSKE